MTPRLIRSFAPGLLSLLLALPAGATIIGGQVTGGTAQAAGGTFLKITAPLLNPFGAPNSVGDDNFQNNNLYGFDEDPHIVLPDTLTVDVGGSVPAGSRVASHYIFFDPGSTESIIGTIDFDSEIMAIITSTTNLANSDFLINTGINYLNPDARGLESGDSITVSGPRQIRFDTDAFTPGDYVRVLTVEEVDDPVVPEPGSVVLLGIGLAALGVIARRQRSRTQ